LYEKFEPVIYNIDSTICRNFFKSIKVTTSPIFVIVSRFKLKLKDIFCI